MEILITLTLATILSIGAYLPITNTPKEIISKETSFVNHQDKIITNWIGKHIVSMDTLIADMNSTDDIEALTAMIKKQHKNNETYLDIYANFEDRSNIFASDYVADPTSNFYASSWAQKAVENGIFIT